MKLFVLDTDVAGFALQRYPAVVRRIQALSEDATVATTIVTFGEDLGGWLPACRRASHSMARTQAYARLQRGVEFYLQMPILPFDNTAAGIFDELRGQKIRIGTNDLAIAAITLSVSGILVTRNTVDFQRVPNLAMEDWTI